MANENDTEQVEETTEETGESTSEDTEQSTEETTDAKAKETPEDRASRLFRQTNQARKKIGLAPLTEEKTPKTVEKTKPASGLDETALDYLDLKGVSESEDVKVVEDIVKKTGMSVRQALKDDYVIGKLTANKAAREVKDATPSSTKRSGGGTGTDLATQVARYEASGFDPSTLPTDFKQRSAVVNAVAAKNNTNKPSWH